MRDPLPELPPDVLRDINASLEALGSTPEEVKQSLDDMDISTTPTELPVWSGGTDNVGVVGRSKYWTNPISKFLDTLYPEYAPFVCGFWEFDVLSFLPPQYHDEYLMRYALPVPIILFFVAWGKQHDRPKDPSVRGMVISIASRRAENRSERVEQRLQELDESRAKKAAS